MVKTFLFIAITLTLGVSLNVNAESLAKKKARSEALESQKSSLESLNEKCGTKIKFDVDWASFEKHFKDSYQEGSAAGYCSTVMDGIRNVCESGEDAKKAVQKSVKTVKCTYKTVTTADFAKKGFTLSGGTLAAGYDWDTGNIADGTKEFLNNKLE